MKMFQIVSNVDMVMLIQQMLQHLDPDPNREGLRETPQRVADAWAEWCGGYAVDPASLLKTFDDGAQSYDSLVIVHNVPVFSHCEHHLAEIAGIAHVGYLPNGKIVGLSKLARVVDAYARRLQVQERLTQQIATCIHNTLEARATGVLIRARHGCMSTRGTRAHSSVTTTSCMLGLMRVAGELRAEFMALCAAAEGRQ